MRQVYQQSVPYKAIPTRKRYEINAFKGCDFEHNPTDVDISRSPHSMNMIRAGGTSVIDSETVEAFGNSDIGNIRKRMGYEALNTGVSGRVDAGFSFDGKMFIQKGYHLYLYDDGNLREIGVASPAEGGVKTFVLNGYCYMLDGLGFRILFKDTSATYGYSLRRIDSTNGWQYAYVPTVVISRSPTGGGAPYEGFNIITRQFRNSFYVSPAESSATVFQMTNSPLAGIPQDYPDIGVVTAKVLDQNGVWQDKVEGTDFTVNRTAGTVTFTTAPGASPVTGEDNVIITAWLTLDDYNPDRINKCTVGCLYGVGGVPDRLFVSGNPDYPNYDWYSGRSESGTSREAPDLQEVQPAGTYFSDLAYSVLGDNDGEIMGYSVVRDRLVTHKSDSVDGRNAVIRYGQLIDGKAAFPVTNMLQGPGAVSKDAFSFFEDEPLFLTASGIYGISPSDVLGERYSQLRSSFLNGELLRDYYRLNQGMAVVFKDYYMLFQNWHVFVLDKRQKSYDRDAPHSTYQYEGYFWALNGRQEGDYVSAVWVHDDRLWFGTANGLICRFYDDPTAPESYNDNGVAIKAIWDTPYLTGSVRYNRKSFLYIGVTMGSSPVNTLEVYAKRLGKWELQFKDGATARYFDFNHVDFGNFTFSTDRSPITVHHKIRVRYVDKAQFRFMNRELNEPFSIYDATIEYIETNKM